MLVLIVIVTLSTNFFYKKQYIKSVSAEGHYNYALSATQLDMRLGSIFSVYAVGNDAPKVKWYSSDTNVARINSFGQVIATNVGQAIITAKYKNQCRDMIINVFKTAKQDILIYKDSTAVATTGEALNKININTYILTLSKNKYTYSGRHLKPKASITSADGHKLVKNKDYKVKYQNNKNVGKAQVLVTGIGDYTGSLVGTFIIEKSIEESAMYPTSDNNDDENSNLETGSSSSNKAITNSSTDADTSSLTPTSPEKSRISSTRTQKYKSSTKKSNNSTKSNTSTTNNSSTKEKQKSTTKKENTKNSFTKSDSNTTHNSFDKSTTNTTDNTSNDSSKDSSSNNPSNSENSSSNTSLNGSSSNNTTNSTSNSTDGEISN